MANIVTGNVRVPLHSCGTSHCCILAQRGLRITREPVDYRDPSVILRCCRPIQPDRAVLEILVGTTPPKTESRLAPFPPSPCLYDFFNN